jgi:hypothetical protein
MGAHGIANATSTIGNEATGQAPACISEDERKEGPKNSMAAINVVLMILRTHLKIFIFGRIGARWQRSWGCSDNRCKATAMAFLFLFFTVVLSLCVVGLIVLALASILASVRDDLCPL